MLCHNYIFFDIEKSLYSVPKTELEAFKTEFADCMNRNQSVKTFTYATLGLKANTSFMLWMQAETPEDIQRQLSRLMGTRLGEHLKIGYTLFGLIRPSQYTHRATPQEQAANAEQRGKYLIVYPFTKTKEWYLLSFERRKELMMDHIKVGHAFAEIKQVLLYAFGVDDHEFIVSYETENLLNFQSLVMELRSTQARLYTQNDTPIFTCVYQTNLWTSFPL